MFLRNYKLENGRYTNASADELISGVYNDDTGTYSIDPQPVESVNAAVLAQHKVECRAVINTENDLRIANSEVEMDGVIYDANEKAKGNINGAATTHLVMQSMGAGDKFTQEWVAKDDSKHVLSGAKINELGMLIASAISNKTLEANATKVALSAAESIEAADEIVADYKAATVLIQAAQSA